MQIGCSYITKMVHIYSNYRHTFLLWLSYKQFFKTARVQDSVYPYIYTQLSTCRWKIHRCPSCKFRQSQTIQGSCQHKQSTFKMSFYFKFITYFEKKLSTSHRKDLSWRPGQCSGIFGAKGRHVKGFSPSSSFPLPASYHRCSIFTHLFGEEQSASWRPSLTEI
jgi:hypothetical protein